MDSMDLEREKGITIQSAATYCVWKGSKSQYDDINVNIIATPGHVDFTIEVERALRVLDGAILVLDSGKGVQSQSITVDKQMKRYRVPRIAFRQQMDKPRRELRARRRHVEGEARASPVKLQVPMGAEDKFVGIIDPIVGKGVLLRRRHGEIIREEAVPAEYLDATKEAHDQIIQKVADVDDILAEKFINEEPISVEELRAAVVARRSL